MTAAARTAAAEPGGEDHGVTGRLSTWLADLDLDVVPAEVRERAKHLVLDGLACALVGAQLPWSRTALDAVTGVEGTGDAVVIGWGRTLSPPAAVLLNSTFIQGFEQDDFHPAAPLHSASLVVPALLATAELAGTVDGRSFLTAAVAGFEVGPRVGRALHGTEMLSRGWHSGAVFGPPAAAAAAGVLRRLDAVRLEDALGLAATQSAGLMAAQYEAMSKRMQHGFAARNGFYAAGLAAAGYTGIKGVFEREYGGYLAVFGEGHDPEPAEIVAELGTRWETTIIAIKSYAAMGGLHAAIEAVRGILADEPFDADDVERIDIALGHAVYHHGWWQPQRPLTATGAQMNVAYATAIALLDGNVLPAQFTAERLDSDDVWRLVECVHVRHDEEIDKAGPAARGTTDLTITLRDGSTRHRRITRPRGGPGNPLRNDEIVEKYRALASRVADAGRQREIEDTVLRLDELADVSALVDLLAGPVARALD